MSYIDNLNQAAEEALLASSSATQSATIMYNVANGTATETVSTANGSVDTLAKAVNDLKDSFVNALLSAEREEQTLASGQTTVILTTITLNARPLMFIEGSFEEDFAVISDTQIELGQSYPEGTRVWFLQNVAVTDAETQFVKTLGSVMSIDPVILGAKTLGSNSDVTIALNIEGVNYYLPAYTSAP